MRIDKFLKVSRIIKRREVAKQLALNERLVLNGKLAKPSSEVESGDIIKITFGTRTITIKVNEILTSPSKQDSFKMYDLIEEIKDN